MPNEQTNNPSQLPLQQSAQKPVQPSVKRPMPRFPGMFPQGPRQISDVAAIIAGAKDAPDAEARLQLYYRHTGQRPASA